MLDYKRTGFNPGLHSDNSVAFQKKSPLPAHIAIYVASELDFFGHFGNLHHAYALGIKGNARTHARMFGIRRT
ncbi:hypothetical protein [Methyloglobulus morosus]|uniref:hypothetical protein n=1 Tax=Methyloglobulus morosus TaxID=1410681 RepID=UPI00056435BE|nr:hypothetical protein [Methyloglobulus morosus]